MARMLGGRIMGGCRIRGAAWEPKVQGETPTPGTIQHSKYIPETEEAHVSSNHHENISCDMSHLLASDRGSVVSEP